MFMTPHRTRVPQRGLSLVELLIGIAVGLFIVAAASFTLTNHLDDSRRLLLETQLQQDLRGATDIVVRDLRRSGYWGNSQNSVWYRGTPGVVGNPYTNLAGVTADTTSASVTFNYSLDGPPHPPENDAVDSHDVAGFRLRNGAIELQLGDNNWQQVTDPTTLTITNFGVTLRTQEIDLSRFCLRPCPVGSLTCPPRQLVREFEVAIDGQATNQATVRRSMRANVRPRNDVMTGACAV